MNSFTPTALYIVILSKGQWWVDLEGLSEGPFISLESAMAEGVALTAAATRSGRRSEVQVSPPGAKSRIQYQCPARGALGKAAWRIKT